jgi:outer membrane protein, heavy metal efflux system
LRRPKILFLAILAATAAAQERHSDLQELIREAIRKNPEVLAAQKASEAARQRPTQQSSLPDPTVSLGYASVGLPFPGAGLGTEVLSNIGVTASQEIPFPGKLKLQGEMAAKDAEGAFQQYQAVELDVISRLKQAYHGLHHAYVMSEVVIRNRDLLATLLKVTEARYSVGKAAQQDLFKAQTQISILETRLVKWYQERRSREAEINSLAGRAPGSPLERPEDAEPPELTATLEELFAAARVNSPLLRRDQKTIERGQLAVNLARKEYYPDFTLNGGYFNMGSMSPMYEFRVDFKIPAYFWRKQRAGVNEQVSSLSQARRGYEVTDRALQLKITDDYLLAQASARLMKLYSLTVAPQSSLTLESSLAAYEAGSVDFLSVLTNLATVLEYEMNYHEEEFNYSQALSRLEELTGKALTE